MLNNRVTNDDDIIESIACMGYTLLSMAILRDSNINVVLDRLVLIELSRDQFKHSLRGALRKKGVVEDIFTFGNLLELKNRDNLYKMEIHDLYPHPIIYQQIEIFKNKKIEFDAMIEEDFFNTKSLETLISQGRENHEKAYNYFYDKIIINHDIEV